MIRLGGTFHADARNIGGRTQIETLMQRHRYSLSRAKPILKIVAPPVAVNSQQKSLSYCRENIKSVVKLSVDKKNQNGAEFGLVRATYKAIAGMKRGSVDTKKPETFNLIHIPNNKKNEHFLREHLKNINSLQRRMERIDKKSMADRRKNHFDVLAYPSLFFRWNNENPSTIRSLSRPQSAFGEVPKPSAIKLACQFYKNESTLISPKDERFRKRPKSSVKMKKMALSSDDILSISSTNSNDQKNGNLGTRSDFKYNMKQQIMEEIIAKRIYKTKDLQEYFHNLIRSNKKYSPIIMKEICQSVFQDLNS